MCTSDNNAENTHFYPRNTSRKNKTKFFLTEDIQDTLFTEKTSNVSNDDGLLIAKGAKILYYSFVSNIYKLQEETVSVLSRSELDTSKKAEYASLMEQWDSLTDSIQTYDYLIRITFNDILNDVALLLSNNLFDSHELTEKEYFKSSLLFPSGKVPRSLQNHLFVLCNHFVVLGGNIVEIMKTRQKVIDLYSTNKNQKELLDRVVDKLLPEKRETNKKIDELMNAIKIRNKEDKCKAVTRERFAEICLKALQKKYPHITINQDSLQRTFSNWDAHRNKNAIAEGFYEIRNMGEDHVKYWAKTYFVPYYISQNRGKYRRKKCSETALDEAAIKQFEEEKQRIDNEDNYVSVSQRFLETLVDIIENKYLKGR